MKGKTAVITGCLKGIGRSTLDLFASAGADVFACAQFPTDEFEAHCKALCEQYGVEVIPVYFDLCNEEEIKKAIMQIRKAKKSIDALVNIAGYTKDARFQMVNMENLEKTFQINYFSQIILSQYIVKLMARNANGGSIVNTSSISGIDGSIGQLAYAGSKAALISATKVMAMELAGNKIRVNAIAPGYINTDMYLDVPEELIQQKISNTKLKRMGRPEEVADLILFLASDESSHITGQVFRIDGGKGTI